MAVSRGLFQPPAALVPTGVPWYQQFVTGPERNQWQLGPRRSYPERTIGAGGEIIDPFARAPAQWLPSFLLPSPLRQPLTTAANVLEYGQPVAPTAPPPGPMIPGEYAGPYGADEFARRVQEGQYSSALYSQAVPGTPATTAHQVRRGGGTYLGTSPLQTVGGPPGAPAPTHQMPRWMQEEVEQRQQARGGGPRTETAGGPQLRDPIDPRIDRNWYHAFQMEHEGQTPEEFYTGLPYEQLKFNRYQADLALTEALDDLEWSRGFQRMTGKTPTDDDWKAWWMHNYGRDMRTDAERERDKIARKGGPGRKLPRFRGQGEEDTQRPPNFVPPLTVWRGGRY